jgi:prepilin-type processing-associated H-X9-DG protein
VLGYYGLREVNGSDGRIRGRPLALAGMIAGGLMTFVCASGVLIGGLLYLREQAHQAECRNHLRLIGVGLDEYHQVEKHFPAGTVFNPKLEPERRLSWYCSILPYLGQETPTRATAGKESQAQALFGLVHQDLAWDDPANLNATTTHLAVTYCPSFVPARGEPNYLTNYVGIAGIGKDAALLPPRAANCGVFGYDRTTSYEDVKAGISETIMALETGLRNGPWAQGGFATVRGIDPDDLPAIGRGRQFGGLHPGGMNVLFVDHAVHFISSKIERDWLKQALIDRPDTP